MKSQMTIIAGALIAGALASCGGAPRHAVVKIDNPAGREVFFQPEDTMGYNKITARDTTLTIALDSPRYYRYMDKDNNFYLLYLSPGSETVISCGEGAPVVTGSNEAENRFAAENKYICQAPDSIKPYSQQWIEWQQREIDRLDAKLDASGLSSEFVAMQKLYYEYVFLNQRLNGIEVAMLFTPEGMEKPVIADGYYDFLKDVKFDDPNIVEMPKWFEVVDKALTEMEKHGFIPVSNDHYMKIYAERIGNERVRSQYLVRLLRLALKKGYTDDFMAHLDEVRPLITDPDAAAQIPAIEQEYAEAVEQGKGVARGMAMPDMTFNTVDGRQYSLADFKGKFLILDFWFTGCMPCKAEVPYFEKIAKEFAGKDVQFISISLDTGDQLYKEWQRVMAEKLADSAVLGVNLPGGFTSPLLKQLNITGVPRIMLIDREGRIIDTHAKRPSDPKLAQQLTTLLAQ